MDPIFESYSSEGSLQLSITAQPYTLRKAFRIKKSDMDTYRRAAFQSFQAKAYDISYMSNPIIALRVENIDAPSGTTAHLYGSSVRVQTTGGSKTLVVSGGLYTTSADQMKSVIQVYIFDTWSPPERSSGSVFRMMKEDGSMLYDAAWHFLQGSQVSIPNVSSSRIRMFEDTDASTCFSSGTSDYAVALLSPKVSRLPTGRMLYDGVLTYSWGFYIIGCILETNDTSSMSHSGGTNGDYTKATIIRTNGLPTTYG